MQSDLLIVAQVEHCIKKHGLTNGQTLLLAYSGGTDSSCLLHILAILQQTLNFRLLAAHLDHGWRATSAAEAQQCADVCAQLNVPLILDHAKNWAALAGKHRSKEALGRALRQKFLRATQLQHDASVIITAHHALDQIETFFIRLLRGAGLSGLSAMQELQPPYLRPLLHCNKKQITEYLHEHKIAFTEDESNNSDQFLRNRIRHQLIPLLNNIDERAEQKIVDCINILQQENICLDDVAKSALAVYENQTVIDLQKFTSLPTVLQTRCMVHFLVTNQAHFIPSTDFLTQACNFMNNSKKQKHKMGECWLFVKTKKWALIKKCA